MNEDIIAKLLPAAMIENAEGISDSFKKMSVNIDRVLRSDFVSGERDHTVQIDKPVIICVGEDKDSTRDDIAFSDEGKELLEGSRLYEEPYITVPRIV